MFVRHVLAASAAALASLGVPRREAGAISIGVLAGRSLRDGSVAYPMPTADGVLVDRDREVLVARYDGVVYAFALSCPHQRSMLRWLERDGRFQCPKHKSKYRPDGVFLSGRATRNMDRHPVRRQGTELLVALDVLIRSDDDPEGWAAARADA